MVTVNRLLDTVEVNEKVLSLIITSFQLSERVYRFLQFIDRYLKHFDLGSVYLENEFGTEIYLTETFDAVNNDLGGKLLISKSGRSPLVFTERYLERLLKDSNALDAVYFLLFYPDTFITRLTKFTGRQGILSQSPVNQNTQASTNAKFTVALNAEAIRFLPVNPEQWTVGPSEPIPEYWKKMATPKLLASVASEVLFLDNKLDLVFKGDRRIKLMIDLNNEQLLSSTHSTVNALALWIFSEGKDMETRHYIYNNQVCLLSLTEIADLYENFNTISGRILENAILAYRYYVQTSNKDLTKSLTEINKTLFEHIAKVRQNTVDLVNGLWRDFTTAFGLMILNFSLKKPDVSGSYWNLLLVGLIVYLCISYYLSSSVGFWFYNRLKRSMIDMRNRIYGYLTDDDFDNFARLPLKSAQQKFVLTFWIVLVCYLAIILLVILALRSASSASLKSFFRTI